MKDYWREYSIHIKIEVNPVPWNQRTLTSHWPLGKIIYYYVDNSTLLSMVVSGLKGRQCIRVLRCYLYSCKQLSSLPLLHSPPNNGSYLLDQVILEPYLGGWGNMRQGERLEEGMPRQNSMFSFGIYQEAESVSWFIYLPLATLREYCSSVRLRDY